MNLIKKWWFWLIFSLLILLLVNFGIKLKNEEYCLNKNPESYKYFDERYGINVTGCPPGCAIDSCYGLKTACCPEGLDMLFG